MMATKPVEGFGARVKARREALQLSQQAVADRCGVHQVTIARIETGVLKRPSIHTAVALAQALECRVDWLLGLDQ